MPEQNGEKIEKKREQISNRPSKMLIDLLPEDDKEELQQDSSKCIKSPLIGQPIESHMINI